MSFCFIFSAYVNLDEFVLLEAYFKTGLPEPALLKVVLLVAFILAAANFCLELKVEAIKPCELVVLVCIRRWVPAVAGVPPWAELAYIDILYVYDMYLGL
jgi:hypothetical protein